MPSRKISRRNFISLTAVAAGSFITGWPVRSRAAEARKVEVAIVGAGLAGLTTARELIKAGVDSVVVLEARNRVGGRTVNQPIAGGHIVEGGGEYVGPGQTAIVGLAAELGINTFDTYSTGEVVYVLGGKRWTGGWVGSDEEYSEAAKKFDAIAVTVPLDSPWTAPHAKQLDGLTVADWVSRNIKSPAARASFATACLGTLAASPSEVSLLYFLFYVHSAGGLGPLLNIKGGAQASRLVGGSQLVSLKMAEQLGTRLVLNSPVQTIVQNSDRVIVESSACTVEAKYAVLAMMPKDNARIEFRPGLPEKRKELVDRWSAGKGGKAQAVYERPFWRGKGLSGIGISDISPIDLTFDNSPPGGAPGVLLAFFPTIGEAKPQSPTLRRDAVISALAKMFGDEARHPIDYVEMDWASERWTTGCVSPLAPGVLTSCGSAIARPAGRIHFAGTETSPVWCGYMDGAVRSGQLAAQRLLGELSRRS